MVINAGVTGSSDTLDINASNDGVFSMLGADVEVGTVTITGRGGVSLVEAR